METLFHPDPPFRSSFARRFIVAAGLGLILLYPLIYRGMYAGDAEIHLVYGSNAAQGHYFEFNPGEKSAGVTSPGFMLLVSVLFRVFPDVWVPAVIKVLNLLCWYGLIVVMFLLAKRIFKDSWWAWVSACLAGLIPGSAYNANVGMENGIFAMIVLFWIYLATLWNWFAPEKRVEIRHDLLLGVILGLSCWLRPEGFVFAAIAYAYRASLADRFGARLSGKGPLGSILVFILLSGGLIYFHYAQTGRLLPSSGSSRMLMLGMAEREIHIGFLRLDPAFLIRLLMYFPLTLFGCVGNWIIFRKRNQSEYRAVERFMMIIFCTFFILYSSVLGASHLARYIIFLLPLWVLAATRGAIWTWENWQLVLPRVAHRLQRPAFVALVGGLAAIWSVETFQRLKLGSHVELFKAMDAPKKRAAFSDDLFTALGRPEKKPVSLAYVEIQARYWLDDRFVVRSLDGRTDPVLLKHVHDGIVEHIDYIKDRKIDFVMETNNFNSNPRAWSLAELEKLPVGESLSRENVRFECMDMAGRKIFRVDYSG